MLRNMVDFAPWQCHILGIGTKQRNSWRTVYRPFAYLARSEHTGTALLSTNKKVGLPLCPEGNPSELARNVRKK